MSTDNINGEIVDTTGEPQPGVMLPGEHRHYLDYTRGDFKALEDCGKALADEFYITIDAALNSVDIWVQIGGGL